MRGSLQAARPISDSLNSGTTYSSLPRVLFHCGEQLTEADVESPCYPHDHVQRRVPVATLERPHIRPVDVYGVGEAFLGVARLCASRAYRSSEPGADGCHG